MAISAMLCWQEDGYETIKNIALNPPKVKFMVSGIKALAAAAIGEFEDRFLYVFDKNLQNHIRTSFLGSGVNDCAKSHLSDLIFRCEIDEMLIPLGVVFQQLAFEKPKLSQQILEILSIKWLGISRVEMLKYETLQKEFSSDEAKFHEFFESFPHFLDPVAVEVWSKPDLHGAYEPDFVIRRIDGSYLIVEIECPSKKIVTQRGLISAQTNHALTQVLEYKDFLCKRMGQVDSYFPGFIEPECLVVIGNQASLTDNQKSLLMRENEIRHNVRIVGFDWLQNRAEAVIANSSGHACEMRIRSRFN